MVTFTVENRICLGKIKLNLKEVENVSIDAYLSEKMLHKFCLERDIGQLGFAIVL